MTDTLYKERPLTDKPTKEGQYFVIMLNPSTNEEFLSTEEFKEGEWTFNNAIVRWLEPVESPVSGSPEEAAKKCADKKWGTEAGESQIGSKLRSNWENSFEDFLAGAAYVKRPGTQLLPGNEIIEASKPQKNLIPPQRLAELERLAEITGHSIDAIIAGWWVRIAEVQTLQLELQWRDKAGEPSRPSIDIVAELNKIAKLSTYDTNHDNMLYNMKEINKLVKELLNQSK